MIGLVLTTWTLSGRLDKLEICFYTGGYLDREISSPVITLGTHMAVCFSAYYGL